MTDPVEKIAAAVLYEGYVLWPYRRSAQKNQRRWTFGGVYPRAFSETAGTNDPWLMQTQCLVVGQSPTVEVKVRFLQVVERRVATLSGVGEAEERTVAERMAFVDELRVGNERYLAWEEAAEREVVVEGLRPTELGRPMRATISIPAGVEEEPLADSGGEIVGALVRSWQALEGAVEVGAKHVGEGLFELTVKIMNTASWSGQDREEALERTFVSTHTILRTEGGEFVSLMDPPEELARLAEECENVKTWPVLAGDEGDRRTILSSPIILYDYPKIAPESPGDLFDGGEIDQLLTLSILSLTDEEKEEARATDPRAREILDRSESLTEDDLMSLHGVMRGSAMPREPIDPFEVEGLYRPAPSSVTVGGVEVRSGSRVRLWPRAGRDIFDIALSGKAAVVEKIEQDFEDRILLAVSIEDDPGREMVDMPVLGHRFFFSPDEVEPLGRGAVSKRVLIAGIGNVFLGDDGFGVEVVKWLAGRELPEGVDVVDFGIRGLDLAYALMDPYEDVIFVDALPRGEAPGTVYLIEPELEDEGEAAIDTHGMDPVKVIRFARALGAEIPRTLVVGCEPKVIPGRRGGSETHPYDDMLMELSEPVEAAVEEAAKLIESLLQEMYAQTTNNLKPDA